MKAATIFAGAAILIAANGHTAEVQRPRLPPSVLAGAAKTPLGPAPKAFSLDVCVTKLSTDLTGNSASWRLFYPNNTSPLDLRVIKPLGWSFMSLSFNERGVDLKAVEPTGDAYLDIAHNDLSARDSYLSTQQILELAYTSRVEVRIHVTEAKRLTTFDILDATHCPK